MNKKGLVTLGLVGLIAVSCSNPEKRLRGTWRSIDTYIDEKRELSVSDNAFDLDCGNVAATFKLKIVDVYYTFNKDNTYQINTSLNAQISVNSDLCLPVNASNDTTLVEEGTWEITGDDKLLLKPKDGSPYDCTIVKLDKENLELQCPCREDCDIDVLGDGDVDYTIGNFRVVSVKQ